MRAVFWCAALPGALCVLVIHFGVEERVAAPSTRRAKIDVSLIRSLGAAFWSVAGLGLLFTLARFSEAFLVLKVHDAGLPLPFAPIVLVVMNMVYALAAFPAGAVADRAPAATLLAGGIAALIAADLVLAFAASAPVALLGVALSGAHLALTQGLFAKMIADAAPEALRATAFGVFHFLTGLALLAASVVAGRVWANFGPEATFLTGAGFALAAATLLAMRLGLRKS
jgi:predicted MFS family arabinose efflux permease